MDAKEMFKQALFQATTVVNAVRPTDFYKPTPDTKWDVRTLVGHMLYELSWTPDILQGATIDEVGNKYSGDLIDDDLTTGWHEAAERAIQAVDQADLRAAAHLSYGDTTSDDYLKEAASDQLIHAWDLGTAIGMPVRFDPGVAEAVYDNALPKKDSMRASGLFAEPKEVSGETDIQTRLLAMYGRQSASNQS